MANSGYWHDLYKQKRDLVIRCEKQIKELNKICNSITDEMWDEIREVNNEIDDLKEDLNKAVRENHRFTSSASSIISEKEKATTADQNLRTSVNELQDELGRLENIKKQAESDRDRFYDKYREEKQNEGILGIFS